MSDCTGNEARRLSRWRGYFIRCFPGQPERQADGVSRAWELRQRLGASYSDGTVARFALRELRLGRPPRGERRFGHKGDALDYATRCADMDELPCNRPGPARLAHLNAALRDLYSIARRVPLATDLLDHLLMGGCLRSFAAERGHGDCWVAGIKRRLVEAVIAAREGK